MKKHLETIEKYLLTITNILALILVFQIATHCKAQEQVDILKLNFVTPK